MASDNQQKQQKQDKSPQVRSAVEALKAANLPNSTVNQQDAKEVIRDYVTNEKRYPTIQEFKQRMKNR